jgi:hypothetical protein
MLLLKFCKKIDFFRNKPNSYQERVVAQLITNMDIHNAENRC